MVDIDPKISSKLCAELKDSDLSVRATNALINGGLVYVGDLVQESAASLLRLPNFGRKSLRDVEQTLRTLGLRLSMSLSGWNHEYARSWRARHSRSAKRPIPDSAFRSAGRTIEAASCLEDELRLAVSAVTQEMNVDMLVAVWGFSGSGPRTLEDVGKDRSATGRVDPITRERVRQVAARAEKAFGKRLTAGRWLLRAIRFVEELVPASEEAAALGLVQANISKAPFNPSGLIVAARLFGQPVNFHIRELLSDRRIVWPSGKSGLSLQKIRPELRRLSSRHGCVNFEDLVERCGLQGESGSARASRLINLASSVVWLDRDREWLTDLEVTRCRLLNNVRKVFSVTSKVHILELRTAVGRHHRVEVLPPREVLKSFCSHVDFVKVDGDWIITRTGEPLSSKLASLEEIMSRVLVQNGGVMSRPKFENACMEAGMKRTSFYIMLSYSPIIMRLARGVYSLVGASIAPGQVEELQPRYGLTKRRMIDDGWTPDGRPWFAVELSSAMIGSGAVRVPAGQKALLEGDWEFIDASGGLPRQLKIQDATFSNLNQTFRRLGAEEGDVAAFVFQLGGRKVEVVLGTEEVVERFQPGGQ